jgi:DNA-binding beta-propeller fold protein YncE
VTNKTYIATYDGTITVIDGVTNSTTTLATGKFTTAVAVNATTNKIYIANPGHRLLP